MSRYPQQGCDTSLDVSLVNEIKIEKKRKEKKRKEKKRKEKKRKEKKRKKTLSQ
jgi:hypothetical protein